MTVPWVVEYLSMMDSQASKVAHYRTLVTVLVDVYRYNSGIVVIIVDYLKHWQVTFSESCSSHSQRVIGTNMLRMAF